MNAYDFKVLIEPDEEAGGFVVTCPSLPGCYSQGETIDESLANIREAIELCLEDLAELGQPVPDTANTLVGSVVVMR
jgi:predicted RNase H-like HicB family nuclease